MDKLKQLICERYDMEPSKAEFFIKKLDEAVELHRTLETYIAEKVKERYEN